MALARRFGVGSPPEDKKAVAKSLTDDATAVIACPALGFRPF